MKLFRIFFSKTDEAAYISHLDLQRVMARALRKSGLPVWYSQGFNPHIYMSFSLPLPLLQESLCESVDFKTEADEALGGFVPALNEALPRGIVAKKIAEVQNKSDAIRLCRYALSYACEATALQAALAKFQGMEKAPVLLKRKKTEEEIDLKQAVKAVEQTGENTLHVLLPAGCEGNINPQLLVSFLETECGLSQKGVQICRLNILMENGAEFC